MAGIAELLAERKYSAVAINYRLAPQFKFPAQIDDCRTALEWIRRDGRQYDMDKHRIAAWGYSAGGQLAALLGTTGAGLKAVVAGGAPLDFSHLPEDNDRLAFWLGGPRGQVPAAYLNASPLQAASAGDAPMFLYTGQRDHVVSVDQARTMAERLKALQVAAEVYIVPEAGHLRAFADPQARTKAVQFLDEHLKRP